MCLEEKTIRTYINKFDLYKQRTPDKVSGEFKNWLDIFIDQLPNNAIIFELGSAQGRDARYLRDKGFRVLCTDVIPQALQELKDDNFEVDIFDFRNTIKEDWRGKFDGILAKAVFLHAKQNVFEKSLSNLKSLLKEKGFICLTFKIGDGEEVETDKLGGDRYFKYYREQELMDIFLKHSDLKVFNILITEDKKWIQFILEK